MPFDLSPHAVREARKKSEDRIRGLQEGLATEGASTERLEGVPFRFNEDGSKQYQWDAYEQMPHPEGTPYRIVDGHKYYLPKEMLAEPAQKGVIPGRGPDAGKTPPLIIDNDWIRRFQQGTYDGPDNTPPGRIPLG